MKKQIKKDGKIFMLLGVITAVFSVIYECFSHGVISNYMIFAFLIPVIMVGLPAVVLLSIKEGRIALKISPGAWVFYKASCISFLLGSIFMGVLEIYGTTSRLAKIYPAAGVILLLISLFLQLKNVRAKALKRVFSLYTAAAVLFSGYAALDTFVIAQVYDEVDEDDSGTGTTYASAREENKSSITVNTYREYDTDIYVAEVDISSVQELKSAFARGSYGKNVTDTTSSIAGENNATLAINGDFYGTRETGYVIRNGELYRSTSSGDREDLVIYEDGSCEIINEDDVTAEELLENGAWQVLSFGPGLISEGDIIVGTNDEVGKAMRSNPRTAIGFLENGNVAFVVSDGRTDESEGLTLYELAEFMESIGVKCAYNLDGGGSSAMYYEGEVINNPTSGHGIKERAVSDILFFN